MQRHLTVAALAAALALLLLAGCGDEQAPVAPLAEQDGTPAPADVAAVDTFVLRAYGADAVTLAGPFNDWNTNDTGYSFTLDPDGYTWRLATTLPTGLQSYKFILHRGTSYTWLTDPEAWEVVSGGDPAQANALRGRVLPSIRDLPSPPDRRRLVIYELSVNDFSSQGTFAGVIAGLTSGGNLVDLGINCIELMPVTAPSYNGWGYDPVLYFAPNPSFGWPNYFALLVDRCHEQGIAVLLDMVLNHAAGGSVLRQLDTFSGEYHFTTTEDNPWGMVELNWNDPALRDHILAALCHWIDTYKVDGFRFDHIAGEPYATWVWLRDQLKARYPDLLLIAEDYAYPVDGNAVTNGYDAQWGGNHTDGWGGGGNNFLQVLTTDLTERGFAWRGSTTPSVGAWGFAYKNMWATANVIGGNDQYTGSNGDGFSDVKFLESHDENRLVWAVDSYGSTDAQAVGGLQKSRLGAYALLTCVGIPMLYNGQEIGADEYRPADPTLHQIDWTAGDQQLRTVYRSLIRLRLAEPALQSENIWFHWRPDWADHLEYTLCYWRGATADQAAAEIVVALNFDHLPHTLPVPFPADGDWLRLHPETGAWELVTVAGGSLTVDLPASTGMLWKRFDGTTGVRDR